MIERHGIVYSDGALDLAQRGEVIAALMADQAKQVDRGAVPGRERQKLEVGRLCTVELPSLVQGDRGIECGLPAGVSAGAGAG